ncbi:MAG TPA: 3-deoxy-8-phosphooctulonate synthase, partial [Candidatus Binatia bacterium]
MPAETVKIGEIEMGQGKPLGLIAGPCVIEGRESALRHACALKEIAGRVGVPLIYKSSYDKANRTSLESFRGPGLDRGLEILAEVKKVCGLPLLTDVHEIEQVPRVKEVVDVLQ